MYAPFNTGYDGSFLSLPTIFSTSCSIVFPRHKCVKGLPCLDELLCPQYCTFFDQKCRAGLKELQKQSLQTREMFYRQATDGSDVASFNIIKYLDNLITGKLCTGDQPSSSLPYASYFANMSDPVTKGNCEDDFADLVDVVDGVAAGAGSNGTGNGTAAGDGATSASPTACYIEPEAPVIVAEPEVEAFPLSWRNQLTRAVFFLLRLLVTPLAAYLSMKQRFGRGKSAYRSAGYVGRGKREGERRKRGASVVRVEGTRERES